MHPRAAIAATGTLKSLCIGQAGHTTYSEPNHLRFFEASPLLDRDRDSVPCRSSSARHLSHLSTNDIFETCPFDICGICPL